MLNIIFMMNTFGTKILREYQKNAVHKILECEDDKCVVKMFCGTGKSLVMITTILLLESKISVVVFPSLVLINQFINDSIKNEKDDLKRHFDKYTTINISSEMVEGIDSTTDKQQIISFLKSKSKNVINKIVFVTYQSLDTFIEMVGVTKVTLNLVCYDEAHHVTSLLTAPLVFNNSGYKVDKSVFFTATPKNDNNVIMFHSEGEDDYDENVNDDENANDDENEINSNSNNDSYCGPLVFDYPYSKGVEEGHLQQFDICIDMYTENTNKSVYDAIARAILSSGNNRVLTFHATVDVADNDTGVKTFSEQAEFKKAFERVIKDEFPSKKGYYKKITLKPISGKTDKKERTAILESLGKTKNNEIYIISSCNTIGEGVDTKNANMCCFVDAKSSVNAIIQNIGRVVRLKKGEQNAVILIPCFVDMDNYKDAGDNKEEKDRLIREQMRSDKGDYMPILNVLGALKQTDKEMYDACINYPHTPNKKTHINNIYTQEDIDREIEESNAVVEIYSKDEEGKDKVEQFVKDNGEKPVVRFNKNQDGFYEKIKEGCTKAKNEKTKKDDENKKKNSQKCTFHSNPDINMLWSVDKVLGDETCENMLEKLFWTAVIKCEVSAIVETWRNSLLKVKEYIIKYKKTPSTHDKIKEFKILGQWISNQKNKYKENAKIMKNKEIRDEWEQFINDEKFKPYVCGAEEDWKNNLDKVKKYITEHNKVPSSTSKIPHIKKIGAWCCTQKTKYSKNLHIMKNNTEIRLLWEDFINDERFKPCITFDLVDDWKNNLLKVKEYIIKHSQSPRNNDEDKSIKILGAWIGTQKDNYNKNIKGMKNAEIKLEWEQFINDERFRQYVVCDLVDNWKNNLLKVKEYIIENNNSPSDKCININNKKLGIWIGAQKNNYKNNINNMKNSEIKLEWEQFINDERFKSYVSYDAEENWRNTLVCVKSYILKNKKTPSQTDKSVDNKKLGKWLSHQRQNYNKNLCIMKTNPEIRLEWEQFINDPIYNQPIINPTITPIINTPYTLGYDNSDEFDDVVVLTKLTVNKK